MKITISDGTANILDYEAPDDVRLAEFDKHKKALLDMLRSVRRRGPKSRAFDADQAWHGLSGIARSLFGRGSVKQARMPAADRIERLRDIAKILRRAHRLTDRAMPNDVGDDLFSAWWEGTGSEFAKANGSFDPRDMVRKFEKVVKGLAVLEAAASYGAGHVVSPKRGRPAVLSLDDIWNLAVVYRDSTGVIPGACEGPFAEFVEKVLIAAGRPDEIEYGSIVEAIKGARRWALIHPVARKWGPSPFDEDT